MKIEQVRLEASGEKGNKNAKVFAGIYSEDGSDFIEKTDVTSDFIKAIVDMYDGFQMRLTRTDADGSIRLWRLTVEEVTE